MTEEIEKHVKNSLPDVEKDLFLYTRLCQKYPALIDKNLLAKMLVSRERHQVTDPNYNVFVKLLERVKYHETKLERDSKRGIFDARQKTQATREPKSELVQVQTEKPQVCC